MTVISDFEDLIKLEDEMKTQVYDGLFDEMDEDERFYNLDIAEYLNIPEKFINDATILPTTREVVQAAVNHVNPVFRRVNVPRRTATPKGTQQAQTLKKFYTSILTWFERQPATSPFRDANIHLGVYGKADFKILFDRTKRPDKPKREQFKLDEEYEEALADYEASIAENLPYTLLVPHPRSVMPDPWNDPPQWHIETGRQRVGFLKSMYPNWEVPGNKKLSDIVDYIEYWDNKVKSIVIDNKPALKAADGSGIVRHKWRVSPYVTGASGLGYDDSEHKPESRYVGLIRFVRDVIVSESRSFTISDIILKNEAWPVRVAEGERANEMPIIKLDEYGVIQPVPPGVVIKDLKSELPPEMLMNHMGITNGIISSATAPRVVRGLSQTGMRSGFDRQLAMGEARLQYDPMARAVEAMLTKLCFKAGMLLETLGKGQLSIAAGATEDEFVNISPSDFKGHHSVQVEVNVLEPEDEIRRNQDAAQMVAAGLWSPQTAIRKRFPELDPKTELGRVMAFRMLFSEPMMNFFASASGQAVAENLGLQEVLEQVMGQLMQGGQEISARQRDVNRQNENPQAEQGEGSRSEQANMRTMDGRNTGQ